MQYLNKNQLLNGIEYKSGLTAEDLITADSYNEEEIMKNYMALDPDARELLFRTAVHISVVGAGNKTFGAIRYGDKVIEIKDIFIKYKVLYNRNQSEKYQKDTLSSRRLVRLLRFHVQKFIIDTGKPSYLWTKYSTQDKDMIPYCFPGAEHIVETEEQAKYLLNTYMNLDAALGTKFQKRLERVYFARKILKPPLLLK